MRHESKINADEFPACFLFPFFVKIDIQNGFFVLRRAFVPVFMEDLLQRAGGMLK